MHQTVTCLDYPLRLTAAHLASFAHIAVSDEFHLQEGADCENLRHHSPG